MDATLSKDGKSLILTVPLNEEPRESSKGKMLLYQYVQWSDLGVKFDGVPIRATVTVGTWNPDYKKK